MTHFNRIYVWLFPFAMLLAACSGDDYLHAIPRESTALISMDIPQLAEQKQGVDARLLKTLFRVSDPSATGLDLSSKIYLFVSPDGNLGLAARIQSEETFLKTVERLTQNGHCQKPKKHKDKHFTILNQTWVMAFNSHTLLVMGPVVANEQAGLMRQMTKQLDADEDKGLQGSPLYSRLESINGPIALVAQTKALPEQVVSLFTIGCPETADASQVLLAAELSVQDRCLVIDGSTFSFDSVVDDSLKASSHVYRPLAGTYLRQLPDSSLLALAMNVDGTEYLPLLKSNRTLRGLLSGVSVKIDMDCFIRNIQGDALFAFPQFSDEQFQMLWAADMPNGMSGQDEESLTELSKRQLSSTTASLPPHVLQLFDGQRLCVLFHPHPSQERQEAFSVFTALLSPMFGSVDYVLYRMNTPQE